MIALASSSGILKLSVMRMGILDTDLRREAPTMSAANTPAIRTNAIEVDLTRSLDVPLDRNPALVYLASLGRGSVRAQRSALATIARILTGRSTVEGIGWTRVRYQHVAAVKARLLEELSVGGKPRSPATVNRFLAALRGVVRESWRLGYVDAEELRRVEDVGNVKATTLPAGRALSMAEIQTLITACDRAIPGGARDAAILAVLFGAGLRRSELVALELSDYSPVTGELVIRSGKGRQDRLAYATNGSARLLEEWLTHRGTAPGPLFLGVNKVGTIGTGVLTAQAIYKMLGVLAKRAGVAVFSPHDLRRTFISELLDRGADLSAVQALAGHSSVTTTTRYDRRGERAKRKAAELLHVPIGE
jgi:integrase